MLGKMKKNPALSIIIISKNEEKYLPILLESIKRQDFNDYELILSDAGSTDKTRKIGKKYGCVIVDGGLPAKGRNLGARKARGEYILFLDSDFCLPKNFLSSLMLYVARKDLGSAGMWCVPDSKNVIDYAVFFISNIFIKALQRIHPRTFGCMLSRKDIFEKTGGFDEKIIVGEDNDFILRTKNHGRYGVLTAPKVTASVRRFEREGRLIYFCKMLKAILYDFTGKKITNDKDIKYDFSTSYK
ncbi:MAG: glycosyltransferase [archaeon]